MEEQWKEIPGYEGKYIISSKGRIQNTKTLKISTGANNGNGYMYWTLYSNGIKKNFYIHRLVAEAFLPNPENKKYINHKDFDRTNNAIENLEWCTCSENMSYSSSHISRSRLSKSILKDKPIGVCYKKGEQVYEAYIGRKYLGRSKSFEEAKKLRNKAEMKFLEERGFYENIYN